MSDMEIIDVMPQGNMASGSMVRELVAAEIDQQISTAHAYPRSITKVNRNIVGLVTLDQEFAKECTFALPRGNRPITGPSIRMAEVVFSQWGNCRGGARVVHVDRKEMFIEAEGVFHDLETNAATTKRVRRRISNAQGKLLTDDMIIVTGNAACSIAFRNAVLAGVPKMVWGPAYDTALRMIKGDVKTLPERRVAAMTAMAAFGIKPQQVYEIVGVKGEADLGLDQIVIIGGYHSALKNEEITVEELLANAAPAAPARVAGSISQRATATGPTQAREPAHTNKAADDALEAEANRVAAMRDAETKAKADAKAKSDAYIKQDEKADAEKQAAADAEAEIAEGKKALAEKRAREEASKVETDADQEPEQEVMDVPPTHDSDVATDATSLTKYFDNILADLLDDMPLADVQRIYAEQIAAIKATDENLYQSLTEEMGAI